MTQALTAYCGASIFDGSQMHEGCALLVNGAVVVGVVPEKELANGTEVHRLEEGILAPGYVDLQVNGGDGIMFNDEQSVAVLRRIAAAHASLGATSILPTLITDTQERTIAAIDAVEQAVAQGVPGIIGLHLEGPHLAQSRKGAHDPALIRPMQDGDLDLLLAAASRLPTLKITIAPENVTPQQMRKLADAGVILSLGHTDASFRDCEVAVENGVSCVTHLFNTMSQLSNREPGLVGAAITLGGLSAGLIADTIHVHPASIAVALQAKKGPGRIFLVSDAMAVAGSDITEFILNGRIVRRNANRLTLEDGTLAGADLDLSTAISVVSDITGFTPSESIAMATSIPAAVIKREQDCGTIYNGGSADFIFLDGSNQLAGVWQHGERVSIPAEN
ncbi:MAG: N-acetylglucosamine-6-phosphate deacetylase [Rhodobacteraceae bacterium]|nr:N-acetylglucosamine-6-phosphate deacetylase [Paracoccaceae bacterium]